LLSESHKNASPNIKMQSPFFSSYYTQTACHASAA
jgi:hypothetical protein